MTWKSKSLNTCLELKEFDHLMSAIVGLKVCQFDN